MLLPGRRLVRQHVRRDAAIKQAVPSALAHVVAGVEGNPQQPGLAAAVAMKAIQTAPGFQVGLLHGVLRLHAVPQVQVTGAQQGSLVGFHQLLEQLPLGLCGVRALDLIHARPPPFTSIDDWQLLIGGEDKTPVSVQIALGGEGDTAHITSSALPGIQLSVPKAAIFAAFKQQQEEAPPVEFTAASAQRYAEVFGQYIAGLTQSAAEGTEEGVFEIGGVGQFTKKTVFDIDSKGITQLLSNLLEALKQDNDTQALLDGYLATAEDTTTKSAAEFIAEAEKAIGEEQQKENRVVAHHTGYESADGLTKYSETETTSSAADVPAMMIALYQQADAEGNEEYTQVHITVNNPEAEAATAPDWVAISQGVLDGTNKNAMVLTVESRSAKGAQEDARNTESTVGFHTAQGYFGVIARDETAGFSSKGSLSIAALSPDPLFTLHYNSVPAAAALDLGLTANAVTINAGDAISDEEGNLIAQTLFEKGLPAIIEALPEEVAQFLSIVLEPSEAEVPGEVPAAS